ncbi:MAG: dTDP-4-dehydrorhamnose reductase [Allosphingosinicella sp.]|uniref:dTDP-4-dehydrorhamnose reductase n=1 Tax=Allosphingosinicella sp. TaxID=2823234 RepID=UPI0039388ED4
MKILVTGETGQLAQCLRERAAGQVDLRLATLGRPALDLEDGESIFRAVRDMCPDVVINAAAYTAVDQAEDEPDRAFRINGAAAGEIALAAREAGARIIQISTDYVYDGRSDAAYDESAQVNPLGVYGQSKLDGEMRVRGANPEHVIVRTAWVYSPFGKNFLKTMMRLAADRDEVSVVDDQHGNPSSALDVADGLLALLRTWRTRPGAGLGGTYHLAGTGETSWCGFAQAVFDACERNGLPSATARPIGTEAYPTKAVRPRNSRLSCVKFRRDFGYEAPNWRASANTTVARLADRGAV